MVDAAATTVASVSAATSHAALAVGSLRLVLARRRRRGPALVVAPLVAKDNRQVAPRASLVAENLFLRQQLGILRRTTARARLRPIDRAFWVAVSRVWSRWVDTLAIVQPATVIGWHRRGFARFWARKSRPMGRPALAPELVGLFEQMTRKNPLWSRRRIASELAKLGHRVDKDTFAKYMPKPPTRPTVRRRRPGRPLREPPRGHDRDRLSDGANGHVRHRLRLLHPLARAPPRAARSRGPARGGPSRERAPVTPSRRSCVPSWRAGFEDTGGQAPSPGHVTCLRSRSMCSLDVELSSNRANASVLALRPPIEEAQRIQREGLAGLRSRLALAADSAGAMRIPSHTVDSLLACLEATLERGADTSARLFLLLIPAERDASSFERPALEVARLLRRLRASHETMLGLLEFAGRLTATFTCPPGSSSDERAFYEALAAWVECEQARVRSESDGLIARAQALCPALGQTLRPVALGVRCSEILSQGGRRRFSSTFCPAERRSVGLEWVAAALWRCTWTRTRCTACPTSSRWRRRRTRPVWGRMPSSERSSVVVN